MLGISLKLGLAISNHLYDSESDTAYVEGTQFLNLGSVPFSIMLTVKNNPNWKKWLPLSESVIKEFLSEEKKEVLKRFKLKNKGHTFFYFQALDCNETTTNYTL